MINVYLFTDVEWSKNTFYDVLDNVLTFGNYDMWMKCHTKDIDVFKNAIKENFRSGVYFLNAQEQLGINLAEYIKNNDPNGYIIFYSVNLNSYVFSFYDSFKVDKIKSFVLKTYLQKCLKIAEKNINQKEARRKDLLRFKIAPTYYTMDFREVVSLFVNPQNRKKLTLYGISTIKDFAGRLEDFEKQFDSRFFKVNSSTIINIDMIDKFKDNNIIMANKQMFNINSQLIKIVEIKHYVRKILTKLA